MGFRTGENRNQLFVTSMETMVPEESWARIVDAFVDILPMQEFGFANSKLNREGNLPYHPADLFKLFLYGYRHGIRSANKLAHACAVNVELIWLLKGLKPSPRTINYFRKNNSKPIEKAHRAFVRLLKDWELIDAEIIATDSTKIRAQNSLKNNFNQKKINRHLVYIEGKISEYTDQLDQLAGQKNKKKVREQRQQIQQKIDHQQERKAAYKEKEKQLLASPDGQMSTTDPDARSVVFQRNSVKVGYNIHATADEKNNLIVDVFADGVNDTHSLYPAAKRAQEILGEQKLEIIADKGYHNGIQIARTEQAGVRPWVSPKEEASRANPGFQKEDFIFNRKEKTYTCPAGKTMTSNGRKYKKKGKRGYQYRQYKTAACKTCPLRDQCTTDKRGRTIERSIYQDSVDRNYNRVKRYPEFYRLRQQIIEHIFGTFKRQMGLTYTLVRGKQNVETEFRIAAISYNLLRSVRLLGWDDLKKRLKKLKTAFFFRFLAVRYAVAMLRTTIYFFVIFKVLKSEDGVMAGGGRYRGEVGVVA